MLKSLFRVQPRAALDGLFGGIEENRVLDLRIANEIRILRRNPFDTLPEAELLAWCDESPESRYPAIAAAVPISQKTTDDVPPRWTTVALRLLDKAPNRIEGLTRLIGQFSPRSWSGSRVAIIESNVRLLDELETYPDIAVAEFVAREKARLRQAIEGERRQEMLMDREADETFE